MVKFATTLPQKTGVIAQNPHHNNLHGIQSQKHKKLGNLNLQPTTVHIQVQQGKNGQQQISLQPSDLAAMTSQANPTTLTGNENQTGSNGVVHLPNPSFPQHRTTATLLTQNIKLQQSPTNIQVYAQQLGRPGDSPKVIKASPSMQQVLLTSLAPTSPVGNRTTNSFSNLNNATENPGKSILNGQKINVNGTTNNTSTPNSPTVVAMKNSSSASSASSTASTANAPNRQKVVNNRDCHYSGYPKPAYSNACLIALALKNSRTGQLSVQEIYKFLCEHFPFFNTAPQGWKNSVRHALSMNKCFQKIPDPRPKSSNADNGNSTSVGGMASNQNAVKGFLWLLNPTKITRMEEELAKWTKKDTEGIKKGMRYPYKLEALIRGEVVKSYNVKPNRGSVDSEDMTSSEEEAEHDQPTQKYGSSVLDPDLLDEEENGKRGLMGVVRTNSILTEAATKSLLIHNPQQNSPNNVPMPTGLATVLKKRLSPSNLNLGKRKRRSGMPADDEFCCLTCNYKSSNMDDLLKHFQNKQKSCNNKMVGNDRNKSCSGSFTVNNANSTTNSKKIMNANNKFWTKLTKNSAENSEGDEDTESEEDEECQCPCCDMVLNCKGDFLKHFENYHNGESLDLDGAMKDSFNSEVMGVDGLLKGAANRLVNADGSLPYKIIEENMVPTNRGEYVKRMRQNQEPTFSTNNSAAANDSISNNLGSSYNRQSSIYSNISDLSRSTSINSSSSLSSNSGSLQNHMSQADDSFVAKIMGSLEQDDLMMGTCHDLEPRSRRLSQESSSCESLTSNDFLTDSDDINDHLGNNALSTFTSSSSSGLRAIGVETLLSGGSSTLMDKDYDEWIEEEWDLSQFLIAPPQPELDMINGFSSELQF